jgi:transposase InsO family protein
MLRWAADRGVQLHHIAPGKPVQNAFIESFNETNASTNTIFIRFSTRSEFSLNGESDTTLRVLTGA